MSKGFISFYKEISSELLTTTYDVLRENKKNFPLKIINGHSPDINTQKSVVDILLGRKQAV